MKKLPYQEGSWFAVPLRASGYAVGVVARMGGDGLVFGYFFGPRRDTVPSLTEIESLTSTEAVWLGLFGDLGMLRSEWPLIGVSPHWSRRSWPLPALGRVDTTGGRAWLTVYDDSLKRVSERECSIDFAGKHPSDALAGYGAVEKRLTALLDPRLAGN